MKSGWWDKSLVIVFSDHGEGLGDHQEIDHGYYTYESTLHVPLIVHWPNGETETSETGNWKLETGQWKPEIRNSKLEIRREFPISNFQFPLSKLRWG